MTPERRSAAALKSAVARAQRTAGMLDHRDPKLVQPLRGFVANGGLSLQDFFPGGFSAWPVAPCDFL